MDKEEVNRLCNLDVEIRCDGEMDAFWNFVGNKSNQRWTWLLSGVEVWYAIERKNGCILAWHNGKRTDKDFPVLWNLLDRSHIDRYYTDDWGSYSKYIPPQRHITGKDKTWKIERKNRNFRTYIKRLNCRTICFSKSEQIHDNVIGMYIDRFYYKTGKYGNNSFN